VGKSVCKPSSRNKRGERDFATTFTPLSGYLRDLPHRCPQHGKCAALSRVAQFSRSILPERLRVALRLRRPDFCFRRSPARTIAGRTIPGAKSPDNPIDGFNGKPD
jgi:hypothetical protein